jgi:NADH-quinone oxidoreductase subunit F
MIRRAEAEIKQNNVKFDVPEALASYRDTLLALHKSDKPCITICGGTGCRANNCLEVGEAFRTILKKKKLEQKVDVHITGCQGFCEQGPLVVLSPQKTLYVRVAPDNAEEIVATSIESDGIVEKLTYKIPGTKERISCESDIPFYANQQRIVFANSGKVDPSNIDDYIAVGGYTSLAKALTQMTPERIIEAIEKSGLRGRGGGGFSTGRKWRACSEAHGDIKYVLCNGDEGDPGAFMDRSIMEGNPHSVLEGMLIGAYAIGAEHGYIYVRLEYPLAVKNLRIAIKQAQEYGLLGRNILGTDFSFDVQISRGAGAFVCGESTALMASIEGLPGEPRAKHIHTSEKGLFGKPTNLNNVETWANVPVIINKGWEWFAGIGNETSKGTKVFSVVGKVKNTGLVEVPMGITLRRIIYDICGGVADNRKFKGVQTGGPSGGCLPESLLDLPVDFDGLTEAGSMMGSGGMIVIDDRCCVVEIARYFTEFLTKESCGKCTACREGVRQMLNLLDKITTGKGTPEDIELLEDLCVYVRDNSICGLGKSAPNPTLSTLKYFKDEYLAHVVEHRCPAGVCKELTSFVIEAQKCKACGKCIKACPVAAITGAKKVAHVIDQGKCITCGQCRETCPFEAVATEKVRS